MDRTCLEAPCCSTRPTWAVAARCRARPVAASLREDRSSNSQQLARRLLHRRSGEPAVEPAAAVGATAVPTASGSGRGTLNSRSSSSSGGGSGRLGRYSGRLRVAVDVDEVLGRFLHSLNKFCRDEYGMHYEVGDYWAYDFAKVWECPQDESNHKVHKFFGSHHFAAGIEAIPGAYDSLLRLRADCDLMVVTSRQHVIQEPTLEWLEQHFPQVFSEVHFGNYFALEGASRKKSEICRAIGAEVLIDDNPGYAQECAEAGIHVLLYDWQHGYPWSKTPGGGPTHDRITRVRDWAEVEQVLGVLAAQQQGVA